MSEVIKLNNRLITLDFFRGLVMFLLIAEFAHLFDALMESGNENISLAMDFMFHHAKWEGLHFWDLVQPFFMFIVDFYFGKKKYIYTGTQVLQNEFKNEIDISSRLGCTIKSCIEMSHCTFNSRSKRVGCVECR